MASPSLSYVDEVQTMMYALGDCRRPLVESALIVEEIVFKQMIWFIQRAQMICESRGEQFFDAEDVIFVLHTNPILLTRVIQKLKAKDDVALTSSKAADDDGPMVAASGEETEEGEEEENVGPIFCIPDDNGRRMKFCRKVLEKIDQTGQSIRTVFSNQIDPGKSDRLRRIADYASSMEADEYLRFNEARQVSFVKSFVIKPIVTSGRSGGCASVKKFREWLFGWDPFFGSADFNPSPMLLEILHMLAYEILATMMDCAFVVKRDTEAAGFGSKYVCESGSGLGYPKVSPLFATSNSQQTALILAQKLRSKPQNRDARFGLDRLVDQAVQPWEMREAVRRLRFQHGNNVYTLFENEPTTFRRVIF